MDCKMSFKDYTWEKPPESVTLSDSRIINNVTLPYIGEVPVEMGASKRVITGSGRFEGYEAYQQYERLRAVFMEGGEGKLTVPGFSIFMAIPYSLELTGKDGEEGLEYTFSFIEA